MDWVYAVLQCAAVALACIYWSFAVTDLFARCLARFRVAPIGVVTASEPAPITRTAGNLPRMIRINGKVVYRPAVQKGLRVRSRNGVLFFS